MVKVITIVATAVLLPSLSVAQQFKLVESEIGPPNSLDGRDVCSAYLDNLNAKPIDVDAIDCGRPVNPGYEAFRKPDWKSLDPSKHAPLIRKFDRAFFHKPSAADADELWAQRFEKLVTDKQILLYVTRIDVDGDGSLETLVKYERAGSCANNSPRYVKESGLRIFVVNEALTDLAGPSRDGIFLIPGVRHDAFLYGGKPYFDFVSRAEGPDKPKLVVQQIGRRSRPVVACIYAYNANGKR
jgi:hypothetical protein